MAQLQQTTITGSLNISGSSLVMPLLTGSTDVHSGSAGQLWINNEGALNLKFTQVGSFGTQNSPFNCLGAFSLGGNMAFGREYIGGAGENNNSSLGYGGFGSPVAEVYTCTEEYNGSTWSTGGSLRVARYVGASGGKTNAAFYAGGWAAPSSALTTCMEQYNGVSWSTGGSLSIGRRKLTGAGLSNSALAFGGDSHPAGSAVTGVTEHYDGTAWASGGSMNTSRAYLNGVGEETAALAINGCIQPNGTTVSCVEEYDGGTWSETTPIIYAGQYLGGSAGNSFSAIMAGGYTNTQVNTSLEWNGKTWTVGNTMPVTRANQGASGNINSSLFFGGAVDTARRSLTTVEYDKNLLRPFTYNSNASTDSWSGGPNMILARNTNMAAGTPSSGITFGGQAAGGPVRVTCTEEFDGSAFAAGGALINANGAAGSAGTQNATLMAGGLVPPAYKNITEEYNGSAWSAGNAIITTRGYIAAWGGTQNAAYIAGGYSPVVLTCTEEYDGTNWATGGALSAATYLGMGGGTQNAGILAGGTQPGSSGYYSTTYHYDGSAWSSGGTMSKARGYQVGGGLQNDFTAGGGLTPSYVSCTERYNGSTWCTVQPQPFNVYLNQSAPNCGGSNMLAFGGYTPSPNAGFSGNTMFYCEVTDVDSSIPYCLGTWSNKSPLIRARDSLTGFGTTNAAAAVGSNTPATWSCTEEYNGTAWAEGTAAPISRRSSMAAGTQNAGWIAGGVNVPTQYACTSNYDGSSFSASGGLITGRYNGAGVGTQNAGLTAGGCRYAESGGKSCTEEYDGSTWATGGNLNQARSGIGGSGTQNAATFYGGSLAKPSYTRTSCTEHYNGSVWSNGGVLPVTAGNIKGFGSALDSHTGGQQGPSPSVLACSFNYNGLAWSTSQPLTQKRYSHGNTTNTTSTTGLIFGGESPSTLDNTEEWNCAAASIPVWTHGPSLGTKRGYLAGVGTSNEFLAYGGQTPSYTTCSEEYNNIAWTAMGSLSTTRAFLASAGSVNAALAIFGQNSSNPQMNSTDEWNGATWSAGGSGITARRYPGGAGTQDAALAFVGNAPSSVNCTEEYNGTSWTAGGATIVAQYGPGGTGTQNAALKYGGSGDTDNTEAYNGSSWSSQANLITGRLSLSAGAGTQNDALAFAGYTPAIIGGTENFTGDVWSRIACEPSAAFYAAADGTSTDVLRAGGLAPSFVGNTAFLNYVNPVNCGVYCFVKNLAPGIESTTGASYSSGY